MMEPKKLSAQTRLTRAILNDYGGDTNFTRRILASQVIHEMPMDELEQLFDFEHTTKTDRNGVELFKIVATLKQPAADQDRFNAVKYEPVTVSHPGKTLEDKLKEMQIGVVTFSERSGLLPATVRQLIDGEECVTPHIAAALELGTGAKAEHWLAMQSRYDEYMDKVEEAAKHKDQ